MIKTSLELNRLPPSNYLMAAYNNISNLDWWLITNYTGNTTLFPTLNKDGGLLSEVYTEILNKTPDFPRACKVIPKAFADKVMDYEHFTKPNIRITRGFFSTFKQPFIQFKDLSDTSPKVWFTINNSVDHIPKELYMGNFTTVNYQSFIKDKEDKRKEKPSSVLVIEDSNNTITSSNNQRGSSFSKVIYPTNSNCNILSNNIDTISAANSITLGLHITCLILIIFYMTFRFIIFLLCVDKIFITPRLCFFKRHLIKLYKSINVYIRAFHLRFTPTNKPKYP